MEKRKAAQRVPLMGTQREELMDVPMAWLKGLLMDVLMAWPKGLLSEVEDNICLH